MTVKYYESLKKPVAVKNLKIGFQVFNFSRYRMDLFLLLLSGEKTFIHKGDIQQ